MSWSSGCSTRSWRPASTSSSWSRAAALARKLQAAGLPVNVGDIRRTDTYIKADISPQTCIIIEDTGRRYLPKVIDAIRDAGGSLIYVLGVGSADREKRAEAIRDQFPDVSYLSLSELFEAPLLTEFSRALTRARVQQYQRYLADADRILILLHNEPDPDAMASGLALRTILHRTRATAVIAALEGVTRPENVRMANLLDIHVETITPDAIEDFDRVCMVDVQPHYFPGLDRVDLVIDHHPEQHGYNAVFKDIREDYGSTCTILTEHLRAIDASISERTATAMLYAIKSDTLFFNRQANRCDIEAFSYLYPLADANLIRKMEGAEITKERLRAHHEGDAERPDGRSDLLGVPRRSAARRCDSLRRRFLPAARERPLDARLRHRQRIVRDVGAQSRLLEERRRLRAALLRGHRLGRRPSRDGQGHRSARGLPGSLRRRHRQPCSARRWRELLLEFLHEAPDEEEEEGAGCKLS